jgi:hypothetical protein
MPYFDDSHHRLLRGVLLSPGAVRERTCFDLVRPVGFNFRVTIFWLHWGLLGMISGQVGLFAGITIFRLRQKP